MLKLLELKKKLFCKRKERKKLSLFLNIRTMQFDQSSPVQPNCEKKSHLKTQALCRSQRKVGIAVRTFQCQSNCNQYEISQLVNQSAPKQSVLASSSSELSRVEFQLLLTLLPGSLGQTYRILYLYCDNMMDVRTNIA